MKTTVKSIVMAVFITFIAMGVQAQTVNSTETKVKRTAILGADPLGIALKDAVKEALVEEGFEVTDITGNFISINNNNKISAFLMRRKNSFVFTPQDRGNFCSNTAERLSGSIYNIPVAYKFLIFNINRFHVCTL